MFARTERLLLRPGFPEDAQALACAMGDERIARNLASVPWPFGEKEAADYLARRTDDSLPSFLIVERTNGAPRIVGGCSIIRRPSGAVELGYWIAPRDWGRGLATEACQALIQIARALGLSRIHASVFDDNPASARVLEKLGFVATPFREPHYSRGRGADVMARRYRLSLVTRGDCMPALAA